MDEDGRLTKALASLAAWQPGSLAAWVQAHGGGQRQRAAHSPTLPRLPPAPARTPGSRKPPCLQHPLDRSGPSTSVGSALSAAKARHKNLEHFSNIHPFSNCILLSPPPRSLTVFRHSVPSPRDLQHSAHTQQVPIMASKDAIVAGSAKFPKPADRVFQYGTAGVSIFSVNPS